MPVKSMEKELTIHQLKEHKYKLETIMLKLIKAYEDKTGTHICYVNLDTKQTLGEPTKTVGVRLSVEV